MKPGGAGVRLSGGGLRQALARRLESVLAWARSGGGAGGDAGEGGTKIVFSREIREVVQTQPQKVGHCVVQPVRERLFIYERQHRMSANPCAGWKPHRSRLTPRDARYIRLNIPQRHCGFGIRSNRAATDPRECGTEAPA
jgi:hypothetical protein